MMTESPGSPKTTYNMSDIIQKIVFHLNQPPFEFNLRLFEFDSKSPIQLFNLFLEIIKTLGFQIDLETDETKEEEEILFQNPTLVKFKLSAFFDSIQYPHKSNENFFNSLSFSDKRTLYPLMAYCLCHQDKVKQDIYLAKYLTPIEIPLHIAMTSKIIVSEGEEISLTQLLQECKKLQNEFQDVYRERAQLKDDEMQFYSTKQQLLVLKEEKETMRHRIQTLRRTLDDNRDLEMVCRITEAIRKEDEEAECLNQQFKQQEQVSTDIQEEWASFEVTPTTQISNALDARSILNDLHKRVKASLYLVQSDLLSRKTELENELNEIQKLLNNPECSNEDLERIIYKRNMLSSTLKSKLIELQEAQNSKQMSKIQMLKKHLETATLAANAKMSTVGQMKEELLQLKTLIEKHVSDYDRHVEMLNNDHIELPDGCILKSFDEKVSYVDEANRLIDNVASSKIKVEYLQNEISLLDDIMKSMVQRKTEKDLLLSSKEEEAGAKGYYQTQCHLQSINHEAEETNVLKENTMNEISRTVTEMKDILSNQKSKLQPMMENLKELRDEYQKVKSDYDKQKGRYDELVSKISSERKLQVNAISDLEIKWLNLERSHSTLEHECNIREIDIQRVCTEDERSRSNRINPLASDDIGLQKLYEHEIEHQESLCSKLLSEKKALIQNEAQFNHRRRCFENIYKLMNIKFEERIQGMRLVLE